MRLVATSSETVKEHTLQLLGQIIRQLGERKQGGGSGCVDVPGLSGSVSSVAVAPDGTVYAAVPGVGIKAYCIIPFLKYPEYIRKASPAPTIFLFLFFFILGFIYHVFPNKFLAMFINRVG